MAVSASRLLNSQSDARLFVKLVQNVECEQLPSSAPTARSLALIVQNAVAGRPVGSAHQPVGKHAPVQPSINIILGGTLENGLNRAVIERIDGELRNRYSELYKNTSAINLCNSTIETNEQNKVLSQKL